MNGSKPHFCLIFALLVLGFCASGQTEVGASNDLSEKMWVLRTEKMSGIGVHHPIPKDTWIEFSKDGKWRASSSIFGASEGQWVMAHHRLILGDHVLRIVSRREGELHLRQRRGLAVYRYVFEPKK